MGGTPIVLISLSVFKIALVVSALSSVSFFTEAVSIMEEYKVVPDIIPEIPNKTLIVKYGEENLTPGLELTPTQVQNKPVVSWIAEKEAYYTLLFTDPDVPPTFGFTQFVHWLVVDIPGNDINAGISLFDYLGSGPPQGSGIHRYVFILYKQSGKLNPAAVTSIKDENLMDRGNFSFPEFKEANKITGPIAANFYRAQYDDYVPKLMAKLQEKYGNLNL